MNPMDWLPNFQNHHLVGQDRRWLAARCYLNPSGYVLDGGERYYFSRFRPSWVKAGFEVIDCPTMTAGGKNAADIRVVVDALDLLDHRTRFDEFVIASGDSDFAPLLHKLRADDRRVTILSAGYASAGYSSLADKVLNFADIDDLVRLGEGEDQIAGDGDDPQTVSDWDGFSRLIQTSYDNATAPLNLSQLSSYALNTLGDLRTTDWFDKGSFGNAIRSIGLANARFSAHYMWDETRHSEPAQIVSEPPPPLVDFPAGVDMLARLLDLPRLANIVWPRLFDMLARYAAENEFNLTESTRWVRDQLAAGDVPVARTAVSFVVHGSSHGGAPLNSQPPPDATAIGRAFATNLLRLAALRGIDIGESGRAEFLNWIGVELHTDNSVEGESVTVIDEPEPADTTIGPTDAPYLPDDESVPM